MTLTEISGLKADLQVLWSWYQDTPSDAPATLRDDLLRQIRNLDTRIEAAERAYYEPIIESRYPIGAAA